MHPVAILLLLVVATVDASDTHRPKRVLVYSIQSGFSHVNFMGRVADTLEDAGMNVTVLLNKLNTAAGSGTRKARVLSVEPSKAAVEYLYDPLNDGSKAIYRGSSHDLRSILNFAPIYREVFYMQCRHLLSHSELMEDLRAEEFDVMMAETFDYCGFGMARLIGAKSVVTVFSSSLNDYTAWHTGTPSPWATVHSAYSGFLDRSFSARVWNLLCVAADFHVNHLFATAANEAYREREGDHFPGVQEILSGSALIITAGDPLLDLARPTQRKIVDVGAIGVREAKELDEEYNGILNLRPKTVVFSMGSVAKATDMPNEFKRGIVEAFRRFPNVTFIWKYEKPEDGITLLRGSSNILMRKWIPQNDLLADARVSALICHGGKTSLNEVGAKGKPAVLIPIYGDQTRNAAIAERLGFGIFLNKQSLDDSDAIEAAIREVLYNEKYTKAAEEVASMIRNRPFSAEELLVKHFKFAAQFGNVRALDQEGLDYPLFIYWNIDILLLLTLTLLTPFFAFYLCARRCLRAANRGAEKSKQH